MPHKWIRTKQEPAREDQHYIDPVHVMVGLRSDGMLMYISIRAKTTPTRALLMRILDPLLEIDTTEAPIPLDSYRGHGGWIEGTGVEEWREPS